MTERTKTTLLSEVMGEEGHRHLVLNTFVSFLDALLIGAVSLALAAGVGFPQYGVFSMFMAAAGLHGRVRQILQDNRDAIWERKESPREANLRTALGLVALFAGLATVYGSTALWLGEAGVGRGFGFVMEVGNLGSDTILTRRFDDVLGLMLHNGLVLVAFVLLSLVYRGFGLLLALGWNACVWGLVLTFLIARGAGGASVSPAVFAGLAFLAVLPHLALEITGYVLASMAAIFASRAITKYAFRDGRLRQVFVAVGVLLSLAVAALVLAAIVETLLPPLVQGWLA